ncbi:C-C motif chemokine 4-like [Paralichthys olivaceus]|uniref:C-C motif chemokine 4-like n=1 Tax=Paralichthys olivaceus TaxID=8255 RepID=UPI0037506AF2
MKTLSFTLGLLLLTACCCNAMPKAVGINSAPLTCCFTFYSRSLPSKLVFSITETDSSCPKKAFIVQTAKGKQICYSRTSKWAEGIFNQTEGSGAKQH